MQLALRSSQAALSEQTSARTACLAVIGRRPGVKPGVGRKACRPTRAEGPAALSREHGGEACAAIAGASQHHHHLLPPTSAEVVAERIRRTCDCPAYPGGKERVRISISIPGKLSHLPPDWQRKWVALAREWVLPPSEWESLYFTIYWMKRRPGIMYASIDDFEARAWARRMSMQAALLACSMGPMRQLLRKTKGLGGWGTLYMLQRLGPDGEPEPHYKVGMTQRSAAVRCKGVARETGSAWEMRGEWRTQFAPKVEQMVHAQLRPYRAYGDGRREWYDCPDPFILVTAIEDMIAAAQYLYVTANSCRETVLAACNLGCPDPLPLLRQGLLDR